ncbi:MAG TPA: hypothetical protein PKK06_04995 [Phycisphaerae bacterium]|nr:hypothetical protein [Phycisphaerae bacterium]HNU45197.1 hypothetical protein [Phycisphaerae bacterium]
MARRIGVIVTVPIFVLLAAVPAGATDYVFRPPDYAQTGAWHINDNWVPPGHPEAGDTATIGPLLDGNQNVYYPRCYVRFEESIRDVAVYGAGGGG